MGVISPYSYLVFRGPGSSLSVDRIFVSPSQVARAWSFHPDVASFGPLRLVQRKTLSLGHWSRVISGTPNTGKLPILFPYLWRFIWEWYGNTMGKGSQYWGSLKNFIELVESGTGMSGWKLGSMGCFTYLYMWYFRVISHFY